MTFNHLPIVASFERWYEGEFTPYENEPGALMVRMGGYYRRRHQKTSSSVKCEVEHCHNQGNAHAD
jgi:hypothetical protein